LLDAEGANQPEPALNNDARAVALLDAGIVELWSSQIDDAERHLNEGLALANRIRPTLPDDWLPWALALTAANRSLALQRQRAEEAIAVAEAHGWLSEPISAVPLATMGMVSAAQARFADARVWAARAASALQADVEPATAVMVRYTDGLIEAGEGRLGPAIEAFREAERHESFLLTRHVLTADARSLLVHVLLRCGDLEGARKTVTSLTSEERDGVEGRVALADLALHESDARAARTCARAGVRWSGPSRPPSNADLRAAARCAGSRSAE
jgi:LuxR family maltose regulon positive regulatory protein